MYKESLKSVEVDRFKVELFNKDKERTLGTEEVVYRVPDTEVLGILKYIGLGSLTSCPNDVSGEGTGHAGELLVT